MAGSLEERALQEGVLSRATRDTKTCLHHWVFWAVEVFGGGTLAMIDPAYGLVFVAAIVAAIFIMRVALAPIRQRDEARALLRGQLEQQLNLDVSVPHVQPLYSGGFARLPFLSCDSVIVFLRDVRLTNRSKTERVSLELTLVVPPNPNSKNGDDIRVEQGSWHWHPLPQGCLFGPVDINQQETKLGIMPFVITADVIRARGGMEAMDFYHCRLEIFDHVSGKGTVKDISQETIHSQQSMEDVLYVSKQNVTEN